MSNIIKLTARNIFKQALKAAKGDVEYSYLLCLQTMQSEQIKSQYSEEHLAGLHFYFEKEYQRKLNQIKKHRRNGRVQK